MDKQAFKQRMQNLKSYRENNPGKGYWDWKVQAYQNGGRHALGVGQVFASLADMLFNKERRTPAMAAAIYNTIHQTQNDPVAAPVEAPITDPISDVITSVDKFPTDPGTVFLLSPENQKKEMAKNSNYRIVDTNSEEDPYGIVRRAANYHKEIHGEVPVYDYIADSDTTIKRSNLMPVGTLPMGDYTPELPHAGSYNSVLYYNAINDKLYQRAYDLNDYGPTDTKDKGASSMYIGPLRWLSRQLDKAGTPFVQRTGFVPFDEEKYYNQLPKSARKKVSEWRRLRNSYEYGGEVDEFQRKTRRDIMQQSLVDGRPNYNKMFQNQNEYQKDFANYWYTERAKNPKYSDQIGGDKLNSVLSNVNKATWKTPTEAMRDNMVGQGYNPTDAQINQQLNILKEKGTKGFANPKAHSYTSLRPANTWHEGIGHMVGDNTPAILNATPNVRISNPDSSYEDYVNQANEKHAQTWDFRGNNSNLKDDQGNYYIDPNRQLTPEDISNMRSKGAKIPEQWESLEDPSYMNRAREVKQKFGDDYSIPYADMFIAYNVDPDVLPNVQLMDELKKAGSMRRTADGKFIYKRNPDNDYIPNTAEHELSHFTDLLKSGRPDAHAGNNVFYQMTKDLTKRVGDKHDDYFLLPTEQKAHMNQLREWMFQNGYINRRDQKVTPEYMSKIMKQLNNVEGMKGVQRAAQQFKSNKTFTKWFNSVPLIGAGLLGVNKYFTDKDKQEK